MTTRERSHIAGTLRRIVHRLTGMIEQSRDRLVQIEDAATSPDQARLMRIQVALNAVGVTFSNVSADLATLQILAGQIAPGDLDLVGMERT